MSILLFDTRSTHNRWGFSSGTSPRLFFHSHIIHSRFDKMQARSGPKISRENKRKCHGMAHANKPACFFGIWEALILGNQAPRSDCPKLWHGATRKRKSYASILQVQTVARSWKFAFSSLGLVFTQFLLGRNARTLARINKERKKPDTTPAATFACSSTFGRTNLATIRSGPKNETKTLPFSKNNKNKNNVCLLSQRPMQVFPKTLPTQLLPMHYQLPWPII